jgi:CheY-like chemotaxis protein
VGHGATFTVTLPLIAVKSDTATESENAATAEQRETAPQNLAGLRVLIVDDERDARELLTMTLGQDGAEVKVSGSVAESLEILREWTPDVMVSDIGMPNEDGYTLIREVRAREAQSGGFIPALALTGYASDEDAARALQAGFQKHMAKPAEASKLIAVLAELAMKRRNRPKTTGVR